MPGYIDFRSSQAKFSGRRYPGFFACNIHTGHTMALYRNPGYGQNQRFIDQRFLAGIAITGFLYHFTHPAQKRYSFLPESFDIHGHDGRRVLVDDMVNQPARAQVLIKAKLVFGLESDRGLGQNEPRVIFSCCHLLLKS